MPADHLEDLVDTVPECRSASYANMVTGVTFLSANETGTDQKELDRICETAAQLLGTSGAGEEPRSNLAVVVTPDKMDLFLRNTEEPQEMIACTYAVDATSLDALQAMQAVMEKIHEQ